VVAALDATAAVLNALYEEDFLGFSYGFRPGRGAHDALDVLCRPIQRPAAWTGSATSFSIFSAVNGSSGRWAQAAIALPLVIAIIAISVIGVPVIIGPAGCRRKGKRSQANGAAYGRRSRVPTIIPVAPAVVVSVAIPAIVPIVPIVMPIVIADLLDREWWRYDLGARHAHRTG
jgi:hypothetical protein